MSEAYARSTDPQTSHDAAGRVDVNKTESIVYESIRSAGRRGRNWNEIAEDTGANKASVSPRFKPLREKDLIKAALDEEGNVVRRAHQTVWIDAAFF